MKDFVKWLKFWTGMLVILVIWGLMMYFGIKARSDSKTTTDTEPSKLYVSNNETLTATKRNSMAEKVLWLNNVKIKVVTGTTAAAESTTVAHWLNWDSIIDVECNIKYSGFGPTYFVNAGYLAWSTYRNRLVFYDGTNIVINHAVDTLFRWQLFRCIVFYN